MIEGAWSPAEINLNAGEMVNMHIARLARESGVAFRYVTSSREFGSPDVIVIPGTKTTVADLRWLRASTLDPPAAPQTDGWLSPDGRILGTYLHGLFENPGRRRALLRNLASAKGRGAEAARAA